MARKTLTYKVTEEGRDKGKAFLLTELPSAQGESWAVRVILALMKGGVEVPSGALGLGMAALAAMGIKALASLKWEDAEPLLDEMWTCVQFIPDPARPGVTRPIMDEDIEEVTTRLALRKEIIGLHVDFSHAVGHLISPRQEGKAAA